MKSISNKVKLLRIFAYTAFLIIIGAVFMGVIKQNHIDGAEPSGMIIGSAKGVRAYSSANANSNYLNSVAQRYGFYAIIQDWSYNYSCENKVANIELKDHKNLLVADRIRTISVNNDREGLKKSNNEIIGITEGRLGILLC